MLKSVESYVGNLIRFGEVHVGGKRILIIQKWVKYLKVIDKVYEIKKISFFYMTIEGVETNLTVDDVPEYELWDVGEFKNYKVKLINGSGGMGEVVDFGDWVNRRK